jgi:predicted amidohydrolase
VCRHAQAAGTGEALPVFDLDVGRIGVFICWDLIAPEVASILTFKGAQLLCFPHLIALPAARNFAVSLQARAVDNAVPVAAAGLRDVHNHNGSQDGLFPTCILDASGHVLAQSTRAGADVVVASVPLAPVHVDHLGRAEPEVDWNAQRRRELRADLYAREYAALKRAGPAPPP